MTASSVLRQSHSCSVPTDGGGAVGGAVAAAGDGQRDRGDAAGEVRVLVLDVRIERGARVGDLVAARARVLVRVAHVLREVVVLGERAPAVRARHVAPVHRDVVLVQRALRADVRPADLARERVAQLVVLHGRERVSE